MSQEILNTRRQLQIPEYIDPMYPFIVIPHYSGETAQYKLIPKFSKHLLK